MLIKQSRRTTELVQSLWNYKILQKKFLESIEFSNIFRTP